MLTGLVSLHGFQKDDIILDYHGREQRSVNVVEYLSRDDVDASYCLEVKGPNRRVIDASSEICPHHPRRRCLGRLANHAGMVTKTGTRRRVVECNMKLTDVNFNHHIIPDAPPCAAFLLLPDKSTPLKSYDLTTPIELPKKCLVNSATFIDYKLLHLVLHLELRHL
jgi:hypothetical protein